jgi:hypothetical protein
VYGNVNRFVSFTVRKTSLGDKMSLEIKTKLVNALKESRESQSLTIQYIDELCEFGDYFLKRPDCSRSMAFQKSTGLSAPVKSSRGIDFNVNHPSFLEIEEDPSLLRSSIFTVAAFVLGVSLDAALETNVDEVEEAISMLNSIDEE